jgi:hypothetical protein
MSLNYTVLSALRNAADFNPENKVLFVPLLSALHSKKKKKKTNAAKNTV